MTIHRLLVWLGLAVIVVSLPVAIHRRNNPPAPPVYANATCHIRGQLPDPLCTPGVANPQVNQGNIKNTICVRGWTATVRPPTDYTQPLKISSIAAYGYIDTNLAHYEEDHLISLELGGDPTDPNNLWAEPGASPNKKDNVENLLHNRVCAGKITLSEAQRQISGDWTAVR